MGLERRGWVIAADLGQLVRREEPFVQWKAAAFARWHEPDDARVSSLTPTAVRPHTLEKVGLPLIQVPFVAPNRGARLS